jgi:hypothetical protein
LNNRLSIIQNIDAIARLVLTTQVSAWGLFEFFAASQATEVEQSSLIGNYNCTLPIHCLAAY